MKRLYSIVILLLIGVCSVSAQNWNWGREASVGSNGGGEGISVAADSWNNSYLAGFYTNYLAFGKDTIRTSSSWQDGYLVKYDVAGNVMWVKNSSSTTSLSTSSYNSVTTDNLGNIYATGGLSGSVIFDGDTLKSNTNYTQIGSAFIVKYSNAGTLMWARQSKALSKANYTQGNAVAIDNLRNVYVTGAFNDTVVFGADSLKSGVYFITKYDSNGNVAWLRGATGTIDSKSIAIDGAGNIYVTGYFTTSCAFGAIHLSGNGTNEFLTKYDPNGNVLWALQSNSCIGGYPYTIGNSVAVDKSNNIYVTGSYSDTVSFGTDTFPSTGSAYFKNFYLTKYNSNGIVLWGKPATTIDKNEWTGFTVATDTLGYEYCAITCSNVTTVLNCAIAFGTDTFRTYDKSNDGASLVVKFDSFGKALCGSIVPAGGDDGNALAADPSGKNIYLGGDLNNPVTFGSDSMPLENNEAPFVASWHSCSDSALLSINRINTNYSGVKIYPNPCNGRFTVSLENFTDKGYVEVYNIMGEKIYKTSLITNKTLVDLGSQPQGIYLYNVINEKGVQVVRGKLVISN